MNRYIDSEIKRLGLKADARHVEAFMRVGSPILGSLPKSVFTRELRTAIACVAAAGPEESELVAQSFGL